MTATPIAVAAIDKRIINLENDRWWLKAIRFAIKPETHRFRSLPIKALIIVATIWKNKLSFYGGKIRVLKIFICFICPFFTNCITDEE
jgi:hypothetical protein